MTCLVFAVTQHWMYHDKSGKNAADPRDFMKLNKMCLKEKASDAKVRIVQLLNAELLSRFKLNWFFKQANHAFRKVNDARIVPVVKPKVNKLPGDDFTFGRANRPQTPVDGIIRNDFGEESVSQLQNKYAAWKQMVRNSNFCADAIDSNPRTEDSLESG